MHIYSKTWRWLVHKCIFFFETSVLNRAYSVLSVCMTCQTLQLKRLHFRCDLAYNYTTITLFAAFSIVCLDLCGKAQRWWRGTRDLTNRNLREHRPVLNYAHMGPMWGVPREATLYKWPLKCVFINVAR